jgi:TonB family protein
MKFIRTAISVALLVLGIIFAISGPDSGNAFAQIPQDVLNSIPSDFEYVSVINVQRFVETPMYARSKQGQKTIGQVTDDIAAFAENIGVDPTQDISYLFIAGSAKKPQITIASGSFDKKKILNYIKSKTQFPQMEQVYRGSTIWMCTPQIGIAFLTDQDIAMGYIGTLRAALDTRAGVQKGIVSNPQLASLISMPITEMFWFAGISGSALAKAPVPIPLGPVESSIQNIAGSFNITDSVVGKIAVSANNSDIAAKLVGLYRRIAAWGQLSENPDAGVTVLSGGLTVDQNESQVKMSLNFTAESLSKVWNWSNMRIDAAKYRNKTSVPTPPLNISPPINVFKPLPSYTEEARKARVEGMVVISLIVRMDGTLDSFKIIKGLGYGLDESAVNTIATKWRFIPGARDDMPVNVVANVEVSFRIY